MRRDSSAYTEHLHAPLMQPLFNILDLNNSTENTINCVVESIFETSSHLWDLILALTALYLETCLTTSATMPTRVVDKRSLSRARSDLSLANSTEQSKAAAMKAAPSSNSSDSQLPELTEYEETSAGRPDLQADTMMMPKWRSLAIIFSLLIGLWLSILDTSIVSTAIWTISEDFGSLGGATWVFLAYALPYLGFSVIIARLADVFGRKFVVITCYIIFIALSIGCGFADSLEALIACRALQGVGGAGLYSLTLVVMPEIAPLGLLPFISTLVGFTVAFGSCLGPILGGIITEGVSWRWIFWINGPIAIVPLIIFFLVWPRNVHVEMLGKQKFKNLDFVGGLLMLAASTLFVFGLQEAGIGAFDWSSPTIVCTLNYGVLCFLALLVWEFYVNGKRGEKIALVFPLRVITNRVMLAGNLCTLFSGFTMLVCIFNIPLRFQFVNLNTPREAGIHLIPFLAAQAVGTLVGGAASMKRNNTFYTFVIASVLIIIGDGLLSTIGSSIDPAFSAYGYQIVAGFGVGITLSTISLMTSLNVDFKDHAVAQGLAAQVRMLGGTIGIAASSAVFNHQLHENLSGLLSTEEINSIQTSFGMVTRTFDPEQLEAVRLTFASSFDESLRICTYVAAAGVVAAAFTWQTNPPSIARRKAELVAAMKDMHVQGSRGQAAEKGNMA